jgi:hypothetical protein
MKESKPRCLICQNTGFANGKICGCISGKYEKRDLPEGFEEIFKGFVRDIGPNDNEK